MREYVQHLGVWRTVQRSVYVGINQLMRFSLFGVMSVDSRSVNADLVVQDALDCRMLSAAEMQHYAESSEDEGVRQFLTTAVRRDDRCCTVLDGLVLANVGFFTCQAAPLLRDLVIHFGPGEWYMYGGWTHPDYRGRRLHGRSTVSGILALLEEGAPRLLTVAERTNFPSIISALRMGWIFRGNLACLGTGQRRRYWASKGARKLGMSLAGRPVE